MEKARYNTELYSNLSEPLNNVKPSNFWGSHQNGVRCYSGYVLPEDSAQDNIIIFSILSNNCTAPTWKVRPLLDKIMLAICSSSACFQE